MEDKKMSYGHLDISAQYTHCYSLIKLRVHFTETLYSVWNIIYYIY